MEKQNVRRLCRFVTTSVLVLSIFENVWLSTENMWRLQCSFMFAMSSWLWVIHIPGGGFIPYPLLASLCTIFTRQGRECWRIAIDIGIINFTTITMTLALSIPTVLALIFWSWSVNEDHGFIQNMLGHLLTPYTIPFFGIFNALIEELEFRGLLFNALKFSLHINNTKNLRTAALPIAIQAILFALQHYAGGFPNGVFGTVLVLLWGAILGILATLTQGILPGLIVHIVADLTIAILIRRTHLRILKQIHEKDNKFISSSTSSYFASSSYTSSTRRPPQCLSPSIPLRRRRTQRIPSPASSSSPSSPFISASA